MNWAWYRKIGFRKSLELNFFYLRGSIKNKNKSGWP